MRRRSSTSGRQPEPIFFVDRNLGLSFAAVLRMGGLRAEAYQEHFQSPTVPDLEWLQLVGERSWIAVTRDQLRASPEERDALMIYGVKAFVLVGKAPHPALAACFLRCERKVRKLIAAHEEPFLAKVFHPGDEVRLHLTYQEWLRKSRW